MNKEEPQFLLDDDSPDEERARTKQFWTSSPKLLFNWLKHYKSQKLSKIMTCFSLPTFYLIVNLVYDLILIQN